MIDLALKLGGFFLDIFIKDLARRAEMKKSFAEFIKKSQSQSAQSAESRKSSEEQINEMRPK